MSDYSKVRQALDEGVEPAMLCATCPWDRLCITPPTMTRSEVDAKTKPPVAEPGRSSEEANKEFTTALINVLAFAGRDATASVCPVVAVRLRSSDGRQINDTIRGLMDSLGAQESKGVNV